MIAKSYPDTASKLGMNLRETYLGLMMADTRLAVLCLDLTVAAD